MQPSLPIAELLTEKAVQENITTGIQVTDTRIVVNLLSSLDIFPSGNIII